ncbi:hypothetical protein [Burkholderia stabilis]|uniref:hypothetical protein n=1 Tax=Burkholderia stabilis TaxID=95485 RepID=UPI00158FABC0|nr:hypothetical protein [Burkholderia stabilis]
MMAIPAIDNGIGELRPSRPIPPDAVCVTCDGREYIVYVHGDDIPEAIGASASDAARDASSPGADEMSFDI